MKVVLRTKIKAPPLGVFYIVATKKLIKEKTIIDVNDSRRKKGKKRQQKPYRRENTTRV